jgi:peptide/nickel transport system permease protein
MKESLLRFALRLLRSIFVVWVAMTLVFFAVHGVGDPASATLGSHARAEQVEAFRERHGLNQPLLQQYGNFVLGMARFDLGSSWRDERTVADVIAIRLPRTLVLMTMALFFEVLFGMLIGIATSLRRGSLFDSLAMGVAFLGVSTPSFFLGLIALHVFAARLRLFPVGGYGVDALDHVRHALLPALVLAALGTATYARLLRSEMIEVLSRDHVRMAKAKGLAAWRVVFVHVVRNALPPIITLVGLSLPSLVAGAVVTETVFAWPGMGLLAMESLGSASVCFARIRLSEAAISTVAMRAARRTKANVMAVVACVPIASAKNAKAPSVAPAWPGIASPALAATS